MNVEFLIHGVMSSGQTWWKQIDTDYYKQFYSGQAENNLMIVEVVNRPHGISTYYNYLRNNNIQAAREGAYFGITVRIDGAYCLDVRTMFTMLDNLFQKMVVGTILSPNGSGRYEYTVQSFEAAKDQLEHIEKQFSSMFTANLTQADLMAISAGQVSKNARININPLEADSQTVKNLVLQNAKIYTSPSFPSKDNQKAFENVKAQAAAAMTEAKNQVNAANEETNRQRANNASLQQQIHQLTSQVETSKGEIQKLQQQIKQKDGDRQLKDKIAEIQQPIAQLARLMSARFPGEAHGMMGRETYHGDHSSHAEGHRQNKIKHWLPWILCAFLTLFLILTLLSMPSKQEPPTPSIIVETPGQIDTNADFNEVPQEEGVEIKSDNGQALSEPHVQEGEEARNSDMRTPNGNEETSQHKDGQKTLQQ